MVELLTAMVIIGILAGLLTTALAKAKGKAEGLSCLSNVRQLSLAWLLYALVAIGPIALLAAAVVFGIRAARRRSDARLLEGA